MILFKHQINSDQEGPVFYASYLVLSMENVKQVTANSCNAVSNTAKGKFVPVLTEVPKTFGGVEVELSAVDVGQQSASHLDRFVPGERGPGSHYIAGWVGPRTCLNAVVKRKESLPLPEIELRSSNP
jgi:hypothetical protein